MRLVAREDLGGYASSHRAIRALEKIEVDRPFVLLTGPNGSGKSSLLRMIRAAMGLRGERAGRADGTHGGTAAPASCKGDLGKLATFVPDGRGCEMDTDCPGVVDVGDLGWTGQRSWLFDARRETELVSSSSFHEDFQHHLGMLVGGGARMSHGEVLRGNWMAALRWALGGPEGNDPYDRPSSLQPARAALWKAVTGGAEERPAERWLFLDEPETAIDGDALFRGLATLVECAAPGRLRVFCASHSPLFAAGLSAHPSVRVLDLGEGGGWFGLQQLLLRAAGDPEAVAGCAEEVMAAIRRVDEDEAAARPKARARAPREVPGRAASAKGGGRRSKVA